MRRVRTVVEADEVLAVLDVRSIARINALPGSQRARVYRSLLPSDVLSRFNITLTLSDGYADSPRFCVDPRTASVSLALRHTVDAEDPLVYIELADTVTGQIEVLLFVVNDPNSERFDTDRLSDGTPTHFGTVRRNISEEMRAMEAGLAPGQVRRGLQMTRDLIPCLEQFVAGLHHDVFYIQPLAYHNAIMFERLGFSYMLGLGRMEWIQKEFAPGGLLHGRLDGSTPFRPRGADRSVRGRSWAIHDGIMGMPYEGIKMYKQIGIHAGLATFPGAAW